MSRPYYADFVQHCMHFYARYTQKPTFKTDADKNNWTACDLSLKGYSDTDRAILLDVYGSYDTIGDAVYEAAKKHNIDQNIIWDMMKVFERKVAKKRGLM